MVLLVQNHSQGSRNGGAVKNSSSLWQTMIWGTVSYSRDFQFSVRVCTYLPTSLLTNNDFEATSKASHFSVGIWDTENQGESFL